ncbi:MAG: AAA family ATPase [Lachnospiraceae bacterium]|nr:AAA family ATPase [Lachnospiraceae bacterium]
MGKIYVIGSQKGGVGKTTTVFNLAYFLQKMGKKILAVDFDVQASLTACFGIEDIGKLENTIGHLIVAEIEDMELPEPKEYIRTKDGVDFIPSSPFLSVADAKLRMEMGSEKMLSGILEPLRGRYDHILIDTGPSLAGTLNINALVAADKVVIVTDPQFLAMMGVQDFLRTIAKTKRRLNPQLEIAGILFTMVTRTNLSKVLTDQTAESLQGQVRIFNVRIPNTVKVGESIYYGQSVGQYSPKTGAAIAYQEFAKELVSYEG